MTRQIRHQLVRLTPGAALAALLLIGAAPDLQAQTAAPAGPPVPEIAPLDLTGPATLPDPSPDSDATAPDAPDTIPVPDVSSTDPYFEALRDRLPTSLHDETRAIQSAATASARFLRDGGPSIWAIAALSVTTVAIILWKIWRLALIGAWSAGRARHAVALYESGDTSRALQMLERRRGVRSRVLRAAIAARAAKPDDLAREETLRVAKHELAESAVGLRALELIATIAPLLGLLGTVLGMIAAFQALQDAGSGADPALLAGGIWQALLTTAAGMAVAIPASAALSWFESVIGRIRRDTEDAVTRIFVSDPPTRPVAPGVLAAAAE